MLHDDAREPRHSLFILRGRISRVIIIVVAVVVDVVVDVVNIIRTIIIRFFFSSLVFAVTAGFYTYPKVKPRETSCSRGARRHRFGGAAVQ